MTEEPEFNAHYRCEICETVVPKSQVKFLEGLPLCQNPECEDAIKSVAKELFLARHASEK